MCFKLLFRPLFITSFLLSGLAFISCNEDSAAKDHDEKDKAGFSLSCSVPVTVIDLTGLDGCGIVLELENGKRLEPILDSSLSGVKLIPGQKLLIAYKPLTDMASICMAGDIVKVTCIKEVQE